jgi:hypothetical protein
MSTHLGTNTAVKAEVMHGGHQTSRYEILWQNCDKRGQAAARIVEALCRKEERRGFQSR